MLPSDPIRRACHANLNPGEYKRVPKHLRYPPAGYYFGCRSCGSLICVRTKFVNEQIGLAVVERGGRLMDLEPVKCISCNHAFVVRGGSYVNVNA